MNDKQLYMPVYLNIIDTQVLNITKILQNYDIVYLNLKNSNLNNKKDIKKVQRLKFYSIIKYLVTRNIVRFANTTLYK